MLVSIVGTDARFRVRSRSELKIIIAHFNKYPLQTTKVVNFVYFCEILNLINNKVHTNIPGFFKLASLINKLNKPLCESLLTKLVELGPLPKVEFESSSSSFITEVQTLNPCKNLNYLMFKKAYNLYHTRKTSGVIYFLKL